MKVRANMLLKTKEGEFVRACSKLNIALWRSQLHRGGRRPPLQQHGIERTRSKQMILPSGNPFVRHVLGPRQSPGSSKSQTTRGSEGLWSAAVCCRFWGVRLLAHRERCWGRKQASGLESGSKLPHSIR